MCEQVHVAYSELPEGKGLLGLFPLPQAHPGGALAQGRFAFPGPVAAEARARKILEYPSGRRWEHTLDHGGGPGILPRGAMAGVSKGDQLGCSQQVHKREWKRWGERMHGEGTICMLAIVFVVETPEGTGTASLGLLAFN